MATITLSNIPDFTISVSAPRIAAIEYPLGRTVGQPGDRDGQLALLRATFQALVEMDKPGSVKHLPFEWPESPRRARAGSHPAQPPPIARYLKKHPWLFPAFLARQVPE